MFWVTGLKAATLGTERGGYSRGADCCGLTGLSSWLEFGAGADGFLTPAGGAEEHAPVRPWCCYKGDGAFCRGGHAKDGRSKGRPLRVSPFPQPQPLLLLCLSLEFCFIAWCLFRCWSWQKNEQVADKTKQRGTTNYDWHEPLAVVVLLGQSRVERRRRLLRRTGNPALKINPVPSKSLLPKGRTRGRKMKLLNQEPNPLVIIDELQNSYARALWHLLVGLLLVQKIVVSHTTRERKICFSWN